jgi:hypothetical protein
MRGSFEAREIIMKSMWRLGLAVIALTGAFGVARGGADSETVKLFKDAGQSSAFFSKSYGYAVFPTIGKGGLGIGGARGSGRIGEWRQEGCHHGRWLLQGDGRVHDREGWADVRGIDRRTEVLLQATRAEAIKIPYCDRT